MSERQRSPLRIILHTALAVYIAAMSYLSWVRYVSLQAPSFDLGVNIQSVFTAISGTPVDMPNYVLSWGALGPSFFAIHFVPMVYIQSPLLHLAPPAISLFVIQWTLLGLAAEVLFLISRSMNLPDRLALGVALLYLLFPPVLMSGMYDTHFEAAFPLAALLCYYGLSMSKPRFVWAGFALGALSQESFLLLVPFAALQVLFDRNGGLMAMVRRAASRAMSLRRPRGSRGRNVARGAIYRSPGSEAWDQVRLALWFLIPILLFVTEVGILQWIAPHRQALVTSNAGYGLSLRNFALFPASQLDYWGIMVILLGCTPLIGFRRGWLALPGVVLSLFSSHPGFSEFSWQYTFVPVAGLFIASIDGFARLRWRFDTPLVSPHKPATPRGLLPNERRGPPERRLSRTRVRRWLRGRSPTNGVIAICLGLAIALSPMLPLTAVYVNPRAIDTFVPPPNYESVQHIVGLVPAGASVLASDFLFSQVAADPAAVPILWNLTASGYTLNNFTPPGWHPTYILIFPEDYPAARALISSFPLDFGLRAVASIPSSVVGGVTLQMYVLLYEAAYAGAIEDLADRASQMFTAPFFTSPFGQIVPSDTAPFATQLLIGAQPNSVAKVLEGPNLPYDSLDEVPGQYLVDVFLRIAPQANASDYRIASLSIVSGAHLWDYRVLNRTLLAGAAILDLQFMVNLTRPVTGLGISVDSLSAYYSLAFFGIQIRLV